MAVSRINYFVYLAVVAGPLLTIPQLSSIWLYKNAAGVSAITWIGYLLIATIWLMYGIVRQDKPLIFSNLIWIVIEGLIVIGVILYR